MSKEIMPRKNKSRTISLSKAKFVDDYRWDIAFEAVQELTGVSPKAIRRASRVTPLPAARMMIAYVMHNDLGQTPDYISAQLNKDRTLTYYYISTFPDYIKEGIYKEFYDTFIELFYHKLKTLGYCCNCCGALDPVVKGDKPLIPNKKPNENDN